MSRLRHPIRAIREPFGKAGLTVAVIALVFAMVGGAFAAAGLNGKQKKQVIKIAKKYAGQDGAPGATGPAGPAGTNGTNGKDGANGTNGSNGVSAEGVAFGPTEEPASEPCAGLGGVEVTSASAEPSYVCNGETGFTETLPPGKTETGDWRLVETATGAEQYISPGSGSFAIPLAVPPSGEGCSEPPASRTKPCEVHFIRANGKELVPAPSSPFYEEVDSSQCHGEASAPSAEPGNLCVYAAAEQNTLTHEYAEFGFLFPVVCRLGVASTASACIESPASRGADSTGFGVATVSAGAGKVALWGTFAVTAP